MLSNLEQIIIQLWKNIIKLQVFFFYQLISRTLPLWENQIFVYRELKLYTAAAACQNNIPHKKGVPVSNSISTKIWFQQKIVSDITVVQIYIFILFYCSMPKFILYLKKKQMSKCQRTIFLLYIVSKWVCHEKTDGDTF